MDLGLTGKICIVTGSTSGIGLVVAEQLAARGGHRHLGPPAAGSAISTSRVTCRRAGEPERLVAATVERFGRVDVLVNNVGGPAIRRLEESRTPTGRRRWS